MKISTTNSLIGEIFDKFGINNNFHKYSSVTYDENAEIISPVEASVASLGEVHEAIIISKNNRLVDLRDLIGDYFEKFLEGSYINFYLNPKNKHFWVTPCDGEFIYTQKNEGKARLPVFIGIESILGIEMFSKAVKKNASISSIFQTKDYMIAMIAVGSLNVNRIHIDYEEKKHYKKATPCGYFSLGSSMLLCFSNNPRFSIKIGDKVRLGQKLK